jgi:hypothetical protein
MLAVGHIHLLKSYRAISCVNVELKPIFQRSSPPKTLVFNLKLTQLIALEDFITFILHENFVSYIIECIHSTR